MKSFFPKVLSIVLLICALCFQTDVFSDGHSIWDSGSSGGGIFGNQIEQSPYCSDGECGLQSGIDNVANSVDGLITDRSLSEYIQDVVIYLLSFLSIIAVLYIIYAGFTLLISGGEEEKLSSTKKTILYVIIGLVIIWLAGPITAFVFNILEGA